MVTVLKYMRYLVEDKKTLEGEDIAEPSSRFRPEANYRLHFKIVIVHFAYPPTCNILHL